MAKLTIVFGILLIALGVVYFISTGSVHQTALIPAWFGLVLCICGLLANTEDHRRRMIAMHIAVTAGLIGFAFPAVRGGMALVHVHSTGVPLAATTATAVHEELLMALLCLIFTALCVRSFIAARRTSVS
jgi:hypothetical protein